MKVATIPNGNGADSANDCKCRLFFADVVFLSRKLAILECAQCGRIWIINKSGQLVRMGIVPS
ncbi:MAG: hypothetical protein J5J06_01470 [Phycisphaerae bacterium]|nr:hypothetical protein [Phycisphaerae bacterium]